MIPAWNSKIRFSGKNIIVSIPHNIDLEDWLKLVKKANKKNKPFLFRVSMLPRGLQEGAKCYVQYGDMVIGWMDYNGSIVDAELGPAIMTRGLLNEMKAEVKMRPFIGFRYCDDL